MATDPLFMKIGSDYYFYHNDHIGTPQKMTSVSGAVVWSAKYSSFGEASVEVESVTNNLRFAGQFYDAETGLHYNFNRYYDPAIGRYLTPDPIGLRGGVNFYSYASENPVNRLDALGLYDDFDFYYDSLVTGETGTDYWDYEDKLKKEIVEMATDEASCIKCKVSCVIVEYFISSTQDKAVDMVVDAIYDQAKRKAAKLAAEFIKNAHPVYRVFSAIQLGNAIIDCNVRCK